MSDNPDNPPSATPLKSLAKRLFPWVRLLIILAVVVWVGKKLHESWGLLSQHSWELHASWLFAAGVFYLLGFLPACLFWRHWLWTMGQRPGFFRSIRAYYISQLGKYTPGKALVVIMRTDMIRGKEVQTGFAAASIFFETFTMMGVGAFISSLLMFLWFNDHPQRNYFVLLNLGMLLLSCLPIYPPFFRFVARKLRLDKGDPKLEERLKSLGFRTILTGWLTTAFVWVFWGLSLWGTLHGLGIVPGPLAEMFPRCVAAMSMSVVLGFVLMTPGGLGPREWVLTELLAPLFVVMLQAADTSLSPQEMLEKATGLALVVAGVQRAVSILAEAAFGAVLFWFKPADRIVEPKEETEASE